MAFLLHNLRLKLVAAGLAVCMWLAVVYVSNPPAVQTVVAARVGVTGLARGMVLVSGPGAPGGISLQIAGLRSNVQARSRILAGLRLSVNLAGLDTPGTYRVPLQVRNQDPAVAVLSHPGQVAVRLDRLVTALVPVRASPRGRTPAGFTAQVVAISPNAVRVTGASSVVAAVRAVVHPDVGGLRTSLSQSVPVTLVGVSGPRAGGLVPSPLVVTAVISVTSQRSTRTLPVVVTFSGDGQPPAGTRLTDVRSFPSTVTASGPAAQLNLLGQAVTEPIDISGASQGLTVVVPLASPTGVTLTPSTVTVVVTVSLLPHPTPTARPAASPTPAPHRSPGTTPRPLPSRRVTPGASPTATPPPTPTPSPTPTPTPTPVRALRPTPSPSGP